MSNSVNKTLKIAGIIIGGILLLSGSAILFLILTFKKPDVLATDSIVTFTNDGKMIGKTTVKINNKNRYSIKIDSLSYTLSIKGKKYLFGKVDSQIVIKGNDSIAITLPYIEKSKEMDADFKNEESAINHFLIDCYVSIWKIKKLHLKIPIAKKIAFFKKPMLIGDNNYLSINNNGMANVIIQLRVVNQNKYPFQIDSFNYSLFIEGHKYIEGQKLPQISIKGLDTQKVNLPLTFKFEKYMKTFKGRDSTLFQFTFAGLLSTPDIHKEHIIIPLNKKLPLVTDFNFEVIHVKINKVGLDSSHLTAYVKVGNPNAADFKVNKLHYTLKVGGLQWADGYNNKIISLPEKSSINVEFPVDLYTRKLAKSADDYLNGDKVQNYEAEADFNLLTDDPNLKTIKMKVKNGGILHLSKLLKKSKKKKDAK